MSDFAALAERMAQLETKVGMIETERAAEASSGGAGGDGGMGTSPVDASVPLLDTTGGDGGSYGAFRIEGGKITHRYFQFGRTVREASFTGTIANNTTYRLKVTHSNETGEVVTTNESSSLTQTVIPLFRTDANGNIDQDYRGMPVIPVRE